MADTITSAKSLKIEVAFFDGDTRTITLTNPRSDIEESDVRDVETYAVQNELLIGDKAGASITGFAHATVVDTTRRQLDISPI